MKIIAFVLSVACFFSSAKAQLSKGTVHIVYTPGHPVNSFIPAKNIGGALDGHEKGDIDKMLTADNLKAMQSVGLKPVSYRIRTELGGEVWHWNPAGQWSEPGKQQGYWVSNSESTRPIQVSYGYRLPRRGNSIDQANDNGYSRLADGDNATFWKSNPYLDEHYTQESNEMHPQWFIVDLGELHDVNAIKINWGNPYALSFTVDYALDIGSDYFEPFQPQLWHSFPQHIFQNQKGDNKIISVTNKPIKVRFVRISMTLSSYTSATDTKDIRDKVGFAVNELQVGLFANGKLKDWMHHVPNHKKQSTMYVSSTDPWHQEKDIDQNIEQAGIDRFFNCGITAGQPALMPLGLLYDTPENALALVKYLQAKNYSVQELEMGEEPEGQLISPVDYAALYYQWGRQVKEAAPKMKMGGPGFATLAFTEEDPYTFSEAKWTSLFLDYLKKHNAIDMFNFFSFEWYPFDDVCAPTAPQLAIAPEMLSIALKNIQNNILPANTPIYLTEYGYSAFGGKAEVEIEGALMYADILGKFMELGGDKSFLYGYEPAYLEQTDGCDYGNNILFGLGLNGKIMYKTAAYYGMKMLTQNWAKISGSSVEMYPAYSDILNSKKQSLVTPYALLNDDHNWSLMLINKDLKKTWNVHVTIENKGSKQLAPFHPNTLIQYSRLQYHWHNNGSEGHPSLNLPPVVKKINSASKVALPPYSLTIITERKS